MYTVIDLAANPRNRKQRQDRTTGGRQPDGDTARAARRACAGDGIKDSMIPTGRMSGVSDMVSGTLSEVVLGVLGIE